MYAWWSLDNLALVMGLDKNPNLVRRRMAPKILATAIATLPLPPIVQLKPVNACAIDSRKSNTLDIYMPLISYNIYSFRDDIFILSIYTTPY
jgi:hypothetical protein